MNVSDLIIFDFNEKSSVLLMFFVNAVIYSSLLFRKGIRSDRADNIWLGLLIALGGLYITPFMLGYAGWYSEQPYRNILFFLPLQQVLLIGPVLFIYVQSLLDKDFKWQRKHIIHFIPAMFYLLFSLVVFVVDYLVLDSFYFYADGKDMDLDLWYQIAGFISMSFYFFLSFRFYRYYRRASTQEVSYADKVSFRWIQHFLVAFAALLLLRILFFILNPEWGAFGRKYWYYLCFSALFLYVAIAGYANAMQSTVSMGDMVADDLDLLKKKPADIFSSEDNVHELEPWKKKILTLVIEDRQFTNPTLTLTDVAKMLETNRNVISHTINQGFEMNFNDFINQKRVESVAQSIQNGEAKTKTIIALAYENGFNSKTTFLRAFKKFKGETASQYARRFTS